MFKYIVIFSYFGDSFIILDNIEELQNFLKKLLHQYPCCKVKIFKSIEKEMSLYL